MTGTLTQLDVPGHFDQQLIFFGIPTPAVDYNIIYIDDEAAVEYDCNESAVNYGKGIAILGVSKNSTG